MKKDYIKGTASFMIALMLTLPIYSSIVFAGLSDGHVYGETDKIRDYTRRNENIYLNITAQISGDTQITPSQLHRGDLSTPSFNTCAAKGDGSFYCSYQMSSNSITQNPYQLRVRLYNDNDVLNDELTINGAFDELSPEIKSFTITPSLVRQGNLNFQYNVYDHSYSTTDTNRCSGIKKIELLRNGVIFRTKEINAQPNICADSNTITVPLTEINPEEGVVEVVLTAYDNFNHQSSKTAQFNYDTQGPIVDASSLEIKDSNGNDINFIKDDPINGYISFIVESEDLDINNVYGDISGINIDAPSIYKNRKASCSTFEEVFKCRFNNIQVKLKESTTVNIIINASDKIGNVEPTVLSKNIHYDNGAPYVTSIRTNKMDDNINYAGSSTTFIVELNEEGVGINKNNIRLDLSNIRTGLSSKAADECTNSGNQWTCYWYNIAPDKSDGEKMINVLDSSTDKLGNKVAGTLSASIILDKTSPLLSSSQVIARGVGIEAFEGYIKTNDILEVTLNIKEKNKLRAYGDFSSFVTTQDNISASCTKKEPDEWLCEFTSSQIDTPGHIIGDAAFNLVDIAGNSKQYKKTIEVMEYEDAQNVSYWTSAVKCSPSLVDRQVTNLVSTRVYCAITLKPITHDQEPISINLGSCTERFSNSLGYIENVALINAEKGSTEPYLSIDLIKGEMTIDHLSVTCPLRIISRVGDKINKNPEIEPVKIDINFYNMPLGEYGKNIEDKIKDAKEDATEGVWKFVGSLKKILKYARAICNALSMIMKIKNLLEAIGTGLTMAHLTSQGTALEGVLGPIKSGACVGDEKAGEVAKRSYGFGGEGSFGKGLDKFCKFVNCQMSPPESNKPKITKGSGEFGAISDSIFKGHWFDSYMDQAKTSQAFSTAGTNWLSGGEGATGTFEEVFGMRYYQYANARDNLLVAIVVGCIPGIINGLDKWRQIECLYADCLQQNAYNNVLVKVCEDQKDYAKCKYIFGEIFAVLPWTAFFDYYFGMIRGVLSDPLSAIGLIPSAWCTPACGSTTKDSAVWLYTQFGCRALAFFSLTGEIIKDWEGMVDEYKQVKNDYCARLD